MQPDFRTCPTCETVLVVRQVVKCLVTYKIDMWIDQDTGELATLSFSGDSETHHETEEHQCYECAWCATALPDDYQAIIAEKAKEA